MRRRGYFFLAVRFLAALFFAGRFLAALRFGAALRLVARFFVAFFFVVRFFAAIGDLLLDGVSDAEYGIVTSRHVSSTLGT